MFYTITLIILKCLLIFVSRNPKKFMKATNSDILNYGIWIQTEVSLVISLWFLLRGSFKISNKWSIMEKFVEIDKILKNEFSMNLCYMELKLYYSATTEEYNQTLIIYFNFQMRNNISTYGSSCCFSIIRIDDLFLVRRTFF